MQALLANLNQQVKAEIIKEEAAGGAQFDTNADDDDDADVGLQTESGDAPASSAKDKNSPPFDVTDPSINVVDIDELVKKLERNDPSVDEVNLNSFVTPDGMPGLPQHVTAVLDALKRNRYVLDVQITGCSLENDAAKHVAGVLKLNSAIKALNLETNNFTGPGLTLILEALATNETLTALKLSNQKQLLDTKLEQSLAALLEPNKSITKLSMSIKDVTSRANVERVLSRNCEAVRARRAAARKASGKVDAPKVGGKAVPCFVCKQQVFAAERLVIDQANEQLVMHRACFKCKFCKQILKFGNFSTIDNVFYCTPHYKQKFAEQGGSYAGMGDGAAKAASDKPTPSAIAAKFTKASDVCSVCDKIVYPTDQVILEKGSGDKALLHSACLKCTSCATKLTQATYMLVHLAEGEKYFCKRHGKEAEAAALIAKQAQFEGATNMYAAFGKEYGQEAAAKKVSAAAAAAGSGDGDVRVDDAVASAMSKLNKTDVAAATSAAPATAAPLSEAEKAILASAKRREIKAEADVVVSALDEDRERRRREREQRQKEADEAAAREEAEQAAKREERRRQRERDAAQAEADAKRQHDEREAARLERQRITDASSSADLEAAERAAERERERAKRRAALEAETAATERALEERRAARQKEREEREAREKEEEAARQRKRAERSK
jgi:hypothetical protein